MGKYRLQIRLIAAGVLLTGISVLFLLAFTSKDLEDIRALGFPLLIAGLGAIVVGVVLWPRSKKPGKPPNVEPTVPEG